MLGRVFQNDAFANDGLVQEGIQGIAKAFGSLEAIGPLSVASSDRYPEEEERLIVQQTVYQRAQKFLRMLKL